MWLFLLNRIINGNSWLIRESSCFFFLIDMNYHKLSVNYHKYCLPLPHRSRRQGSWVGDDILERRLLDALVLTVLNLANS